MSAPRIAVMVAAGVLATGRAAHADEVPLATARAQLASCEGLGEVTRVETIGRRPADEVLHVWRKDGPRAIVTFDPDEDACAVLPIGRAAARATGTFLPGGGPHKAYALLADGGCDGASCPGVIVVRDRRDETRLRDALPYDHGCMYGLELTTVRLWPRLDSLLVVCRSGGGPGYTATAELLHGDGGALRSLLAWYHGARIEASPDELAEGDCHVDPVGALAVRRRGAAPIVRITRGPIDVEDAEPGWPVRADGVRSCRGQRALVQDWAWDARAGQLVARGAARKRLRDVCDCPRRTRR